MSKSFLAVLAVAVLALTGCSEDPEPPAPPVDRWFTASDGVRLHYLEVAGRGTPIILLHGFMGGAEPSWIAPGIAQVLAEEGYRLVILDQRGHGASDKPHSAASYGERNVTDVIELMDALGLHRVHLVGYSMGASMTRVLMARIPERIISASLGGAGVEELDDAIRAEAESRDPRGTDPDEERILEAAADGPPPDMEAMLALTQAWGAWWPQAIDLDSIDFPVQAVNGEFDAPHSKTVRPERELARFENVIVPGRTHLTTLIDPLYHSRLRDFLAAHDTP
ncbi:alpha/beta hydrolase [Myxococcus sp. K15C18031901]|uniref:alpha/beta fold hydrolase n=1 Tax=Myxococcus dinghuensis TaxID=2906761 RepID=UPI0020A7C712|nr:alpha/beta hydrolase [Myxococcus dinghuensis]MCP3098030.1 alpha/beta hydrolase [Myxococcus dinghuensis]